MSREWNKAAAFGLQRSLYFALHQVREYDNRLAISRHDGRQLTWDELQAVKRRVWGDILAIELYPVELETANERNTRHLWRVSSDLEHKIRAVCTHPEFFVALKEDRRAREGNSLQDRGS